MPLDVNDLGKIQAMLDRYIPLREYENRHVELAQRVSNVEGRQNEMAHFIIAEFEKTRIERESHFHRSLDAIKEVAHQCDEIKAQIATKDIKDAQEESKNRFSTLRYIVTTLVTFILGLITYFLISYIK